jgi:hypothetical protein
MLRMPGLSPPGSGPFRQRTSPAWAGSAGEVGTVLYIAVIAMIAQATGLSYVLFPELGALSHDILKRPHGTWARVPRMLMATPILTSVIGTLVTQHMAFGLLSVLLIVGSSILVIRVLRSPIAPAISAGLLPLVLGEPSWWYPPGLLVGLGLLAGISVLWRRIVPVSSMTVSISDLADDMVEEAPRDYSWIAFFLVFLVGVTLLAELTGLRFLLFPPLVVVGFEMFAHATICPWADRPLILPVACTITAVAGVALVGVLGAGPLAAAGSMVVGIVVLRIFDLHVPPALAVGLLPLVMVHPTYVFAASVGVGTLLLTLSFLVWRKVARATVGAGGGRS